MTHSNIEFECKCAVGLPEHFTRKIARYYICLGMPIVVDSSVLYSFVSFLQTPASAGNVAERQH